MALNGTGRQHDQFEGEVDKLIEWLQNVPHLPNITGKNSFSV